MQVNVEIKRGNAIFLEHTQEGQIFQFSVNLACPVYMRIGADYYINLNSGEVTVLTPDNRRKEVYLVRKAVLYVEI